MPIIFPSTASGSGTSGLVARLGYVVFNSFDGRLHRTLKSKSTKYGIPTIEKVRIYIKTSQTKIQVSNYIKKKGEKTV
jgi:hypothetical protein